MGNGISDILIKSIESQILFLGKISTIDDFAEFQRLSSDEIEQITSQLENYENSSQVIEFLDKNNIAFATTSMGRAVFQINSQGMIVNYKGVDSQLKEEELGLRNIMDVISIPLDDRQLVYPINFIIHKDGQLEIRMRGAAPLEDLEIEGMANCRLNEFGVKTTSIASIREFSPEILKRFNLPTLVEGESLRSTYDDEIINIKNFLKGANYTGEYETYERDGLRPQKMSEFLLTTENRPKIEKVIEKLNQKANGTLQENLTVEKFIQGVDHYYELGQRYGQSVRTMENPFRISDLEVYVNEAYGATEKNKKITSMEAIENIVGLTEELQSIQTNSQVEQRKPFEVSFAETMGANIANLMNNGWVCDNFRHRQDYTLAGEMCDDSYYSLVDEINNIKNKEDEHGNETEQGKKDALIEKNVEKFCLQFFLIGSNIKILQNEMSLRGIEQSKIDEVLEEYMDSFLQNLDLEKMKQSIGNELYTIIQEKFKSIPDKISELEEINGNHKNGLALMMAAESRKEGIFVNNEIYNSNYMYNDFYYKLFEKIKAKLLDKQKAKSALGDCLSGDTLRSGLTGEAIEAVNKAIRSNEISKKNEIDEDEQAE